MEWQRVSWTCVYPSAGIVENNSLDRVRERREMIDQSVAAQLHRRSSPVTERYHDDRDAGIPRGLDVGFAVPDIETLTGSTPSAVVTLS